MWIQLLFLFLQLSLAGLFLFLCLAFVTGGPFVPSNKTAVAAMISLAKLKKGDRVIDVGSGDGRVLFAAAKNGAIATGLEINPYLVHYTNLLAFVTRNTHVHAVWKNLWKADISGADVVFVYLIPWKMDVLAAKLVTELKPGALVISNSFIFPGWKLVRSDEKHHVYAYQMPQKGI